MKITRSNNKKVSLLKFGRVGAGDGSTVKSSYCSYRGLGVSSKHPYDSSQLFVTPDPVSSAHFWSSHLPSTHIHGNIYTG